MDFDKYLKRFKPTDEIDADWIGLVGYEEANPDVAGVIVGVAKDYNTPYNIEHPIVFTHKINEDGSREFIFREKSNTVYIHEQDSLKQGMEIRKSIYAIEYLLNFIDVNALYYQSEKIKAKNSNDPMLRKFYGID